MKGGFYAYSLLGNNKLVLTDETTDSVLILVPGNRGAVDQHFPGASICLDLCITREGKSKERKLNIQWQQYVCNGGGWSLNRHVRFCWYLEGKRLGKDTGL